MVQKCQREMRHSLGDRSQGGDAHAVDKETLVHSFAGGDDRGRVIPQDHALWVVGFRTFGSGKNRKG